MVEPHVDCNLLGRVREGDNVEKVEKVDQEQEDSIANVDQVQGDKDGDPD